MKKDYINKIDDKAERRNITNPVEIRSEMEGEEMVSTITGYAAVFDKITDMSWYLEKIDKSAFTNADMSDVVALFNHDDDEILSRTTGNKDDLVLTIDSTGLKYEFKAKNECSKEVAENISLGFIKGSSFAFSVSQESWEYDVKQADGSTKDIRTILGFEKIYDVSPVTWPAYSDTSVALRSAEKSKPKKSGQQAFYEIKLTQK